jgi:serine/threonine protein kinase
MQLQTDPYVGTVLANVYEIHSIIGHGGMGVVYKARHAMMDRIVAIKMLKAQLITDSMSVKRFQQEVKASSRINHPHVVAVYNFGLTPQGLPYIVMDYLEGNTLAGVIRRDGQLGVERGVKIVSQACEGLAYAHKQGVVHRDLKPGNIVLTDYDGDSEFVKVVDFGVAKLMGGTADSQRLTQAGDICGSPVYMSPEQCMGQELDWRSDIYSMGVVIYETLTGCLPLVGTTMVDTMAKQCSEMPPPFATARPDLYIPERIQQVVFKALAKDPNNRHQSMDELREELYLAIPRPGRSGALRNAELLTDTTQHADKKAEVSSKPKVIWIAAIVACLIGLVAVITMFVSHPTARNAASPDSKTKSKGESTAVIPGNPIKAGDANTPGNVGTMGTTSGSTGTTTNSTGDTAGSTSSMNGATDAMSGTDRTGRRASVGGVDHDGSANNTGSIKLDPGHQPGTSPKPENGSGLASVTAGDQKHSDPPISEIKVPISSGPSRSPAPTVHKIPATKAEVRVHRPLPVSARPAVVSPHKINSAKWESLRQELGN